MVESLKIQVALDGSEEVQSKMRDLGKSIRKTFIGIDAAVARLSITFAALGAVIGVAAATKLSSFANAAEDTAKALTQLQKVSGQSFESLSSLQQVFAAGGTPLAKFADEFGKLSESIAAAGQQAAIRKADKDVVQWANDVDTVRKKFDDLNVGALSRLTTLDTKVQALRESLAKVPASDQWFKLADIFKNLGSDLERAQIGKALGLSPETITTLTQGSEALRRLQAEAQRLGLTLTTSNQQALAQMGQQWNQFSNLVTVFFQKIGAMAAPAIASLLQAFQMAMQQIITDFQNLPLDQAVANMASRLGPAFAQVGQVLGPVLSQIGSALGKALVDGVIAAVRARFAGADTMGPLQPGDTGFEGRAGGGLLGGRGTGTSDSNLAWVSRGEHIMPARAVAQPGVLAFLEALRRSGGNLSAVLNGMGRFALGGMVPRTMPAFASGGLSGGNNVTIQFPGLPAIGGLRASSAWSTSCAGLRRWRRFVPVAASQAGMPDAGLHPACNRRHRLHAICRARHHHDAGTDRSGQEPSTRLPRRADRHLARAVPAIQGHDHLHRS